MAASFICRRLVHQPHNSALGYTPGSLLLIATTAFRVSVKQCPLCCPIAARPHRKPLERTLLFVLSRYYCMSNRNEP